MPICMLSTLLVGGKDISVVQHMAQFFSLYFLTMHYLNLNLEGMHIQKIDKCDLAKD